jgi:dCMP deaminase
MTDQEKWDNRFLDLAKLISTWSKDPSTKTGCVIVKDRQILATGYNGFPRGVEDRPERYNDRPTKYRFIEHCDRNAIYQAAKVGVSLVGATMYLTGPPCHDCTRGIIQSGITVVAYPYNNPFDNDPKLHERWADSMQAAHAMLFEAGIEVRMV